jgi:hypothetical protein
LNISLNQARCRLLAVLFSGFGVEVHASGARHLERQVWSFALDFVGKLSFDRSWSDVEQGSRHLAPSGCWLEVVAFSGLKMEFCEYLNL